MPKKTKHNKKHNKSYKTKIYKKTLKKTIEKAKKNGSRKYFNPMNCNPTVKDLTPNKESCFTNSVLITLKDSYNKHHSTNPIQYVNPNDIWKELKNRMSTCSREDCWLNEIKDQKVRKQILKYSFAPYVPDDWKNDKEWLSNFDIRDVLEQYEQKYSNFKLLGPTPIDFDSRPDYYGGNCVWNEICNFNVKETIKSGKTKLGAVFNLAKHTKSGSHWVSMFIDLDDNYIFYMDSAGRTIIKEIKNFSDRVIEQCNDLSPPKLVHFHENCPTEHQMGDRECGMYCLFFIITMLTNRIEDREFKNYNEKIELFKNERIPDTYMKNYRKIYFNDKK
jgi:hypothetical protein